MTVSITNASSMPFTVSLYHDSYCAVSGRCECKRVAAQAAIAGAHGGLFFQHQQRRVPRTLHVEPGATVGGLPDAVLQVPQVAHARKSRPPRIQVNLTPTVAAAPQAPPTQRVAPSAPPATGQETSSSVDADETPQTLDSDAQAGGESGQEGAPRRPRTKARS